MTKFKKQNILPCKFKKKIKGPLFHCREISDQKYWWSGKTLSVLSKSIVKPRSFFIKFLTKFVWKLEKLKSQNFKGCMFDGPVIVQLFHNLNLGFRSISQKILKDCHFVVGGSKNLKLSTNTCFGVSFQKNVLSSLLLFLSVCYQDDLSESERNETASSTARNFNNSWLL